MSAVDIEAENRAVLVVLSQADEYYKEQQRLAKALRKGFLDLAKARSGLSCRISALDCREELRAQFTVDAEAVSSSVHSLEASTPWRPHVESSSGSIGTEGGIHRRSGRSLSTEDEEDGLSEVTLETQSSSENTDTVLLFTALAPPTLRKAKKEFIQALSNVLKLANAAQRIHIAQQKLAPVINNERFAI